MHCAARLSSPHVTCNGLAVALVALLLCASAAPPAVAESFPATISADYAHVRSGPGAEHYATEVVRRGDSVDVVGRDADGWCRIRPPRDSFSWIAGEDLLLGRDGTAQVARDGAKIYVGSPARDRAEGGVTRSFDPRRHSPQVTLRQGEYVELLPGQRPRRGLPGPAWYMIASPASEVRWIDEQHLRHEGLSSGAAGDAVIPAAAISSIAPQSAAAHPESLLPAWSPTSSGSVLPAQFAPLDSSAPLTAAPPAGGVVVPGPAAPVMPYLQAVPAATRVYASLDALGWWVQGDSLPPLVTTSPIGTAQQAAGVLGLPGTTILFGNEKVNDDIRPGGRVQGGVWLDPLQTFAVEGHYYALASATTTFSRTSEFEPGSDAIILASPFFNNAPGVNAQESLLIAFPNFMVGPVAVDLDGSVYAGESSRITSAGGGGRYALSPHTSPRRFFLLGGYRFFSLNEDLAIVRQTFPGSNPFPFPIPQGLVQTADSFSTRNSTLR